MAGILDFLQSPDAQLGIGLLAAGGPTTDPNQTGFGQRLAGAMNHVTANQQVAMRAKLMQSQIDENASQNALRQAQMSAAQQKQVELASLFGGGAANGGGTVAGGAPGGLQLKGMPVENVAKLKTMYGIDLMDQWKAANVPTQFTAGSYAHIPGQRAEYLPDPTKGVGFNGQQITVLPGSENLAVLAGQQAGATAHAQARWQEGTPVYNGQNQKVIQSRADLLGGGQQNQMPDYRASFNGLPPAQAGMTSSFEGDPAKVLPLIAGIKDPQERANAYDAYSRQMTGGGAPASAPAGNVVELSPAEQARNKASEEALVTQAKGEVVLKQDKQKALDSGNDALRTIDKALGHPGLETGTGLSSKVNPKNYIPGTDAYNFGAVRDQLKGQAFLQAFASLKGGGQITEVEGTKAENAMARLNNAQSTKEYKDSLQDLRDVVDRGLRRTRGENVPDVPLASNDGTPASRLKAAPSDSDLRNTALKYGMTVDQVKQKLGIQ
jgi:hypothetical protein